MILCRLLSAARAYVLDRVLGPEEDFEYTGTTTPDDIS